jgi:hypothetical protein
MKTNLAFNYMVLKQVIEFSMSISSNLKLDIPLIRRLDRVAVQSVLIIRSSLFTEQAQRKAKTSILEGY